MNLSEALKIIEKAPKHKVVCGLLGGVPGCGYCPIKPFKQDNPGKFSCHDIQNNFALLETIRIAVRKEKLEKLLS